MTDEEIDNAIEDAVDAEHRYWQNKIRDKIYRFETLGLGQDQTIIDVLKELLES